MSNITTLAFENTTFEIVDQNGQPWLRTTDVANALGYSRSDKVGRLYSRNADEFTPAMTAVIETPTSGVSGNLVTETRIFSLRGAHLLAMFARTEKAKAFRVWLLDLIEAQARNTRPHNPAIDYDRISPAQAQDLKELVHSIVDADIQNFTETWAQLHRKFRVNSHLELPAARFDEARDYLLGKLPDEAKPLPDAQRLQLDFSVAAEAGAQVQRSVFEQLANGACRRYITQDMLEPIHNLIRHAIDADRAARAPADSVTEPAGAGVAHALSDGQIEAMPVWRNFVWLWPESRREIVDAVVDVLTTPPTQAADSVLEDAARLDWLLLHISGAEFRRIGVHYSGNASRADVDAARKQGANHD